MMYVETTLNERKVLKAPPETNASGSAYEKKVKKNINIGESTASFTVIKVDMNVM